MYIVSELMIGMEGSDVGDRWMLHIRNNGMKNVRASESVSNRLADQITTLGCAQIDRPAKSPTLNTRKWQALKSKG
jgi:hypothetical protein